MKHTEIFKNARWIESEPMSDAPIFMRRFTAHADEKAEITICGLGCFKLYINGKKVSEDLFAPNASSYGARDMSRFNYPITDEISYRLYCMKYSVSEYLVEGENTLAVILGGGYYHQGKKSGEGPVDFGTPKLCYILEKASGNVISDENTLCNGGFVTENNLYAGEKHDYTLVPDSENDFSHSREIASPKVEMYIQSSPCDRVIRTLTPKLIAEENGVKIYDAGENTVGYAVFTCREAGKKIKVSYAEELEDKWAHTVTFRKGFQEDEFITDGSEREYVPHFTWHGFRYFKVEGAQPLRVDVVHSDCPQTSAFCSDNEQLNWLYDAFIRTQLCNMHCGVPSDCPQLERLGYTGDGQLCAETVMLLLDCKEFYRKWLYDVADCQCKKSGHVQHTAPFMGGGGGPAGWGGAIVEVPYNFYKIYGDRDLLDEFFPKMLAYLDYLESRSENGLVWREEQGGWCLGDWCTPDSIKIPESYVNTCLYVGFMNRVIEISEILGKKTETVHLPERIERVKKAIDIAYFSSQQRAYCGDVQGASCLALKIGLGNEGVRQKVVDKYSQLGMYDTGIIATKMLTEYLFEIGETQLAFNLLAGKKEISFDRMRREGATTLWEYWTGKRSHNHPMFGAVTKYIFTYLLGISQPEESAGFESIVISPRFVDGMNTAKGHITTERGIISVEYKKDGGVAEVKVFADPRIKAVFDCGGVKESFSGEKEFIVKL